MPKFRVEVTTSTKHLYRMHIDAATATEAERIALTERTPRDDGTLVRVLTGEPLISSIEEV